MSKRVGKFVFAYCVCRPSIRPLCIAFFWLSARLSLMGRVHYLNYSNTVEKNYNTMKHLNKILFKQSTTKCVRKTMMRTEYKPIRNRLSLHLRHPNKMKNIIDAKVFTGSMGN